jgi:hypothetical protein
MLMEYIDITNAGTYDFLYCGLTFKISASTPSHFDSADHSVGYAFINFIDPNPSFPLPMLELEQNGTSHSDNVNLRNRFHSDKICDISYANIQGKECLIEKFRNSCVMDEDPSYRPKSSTLQVR